MTNHKKKRRFGVGGSGITEDRWDYLQRIKVGPVRLPPEEIDAETFRELLERQDIPLSELKEPEEMPTAEEFMKLLANPTARTSFQRRTQQERYTTNRKYFEDQEKYWWYNQQMQIWRALDENKHQYKLGAYNMWITQVLMPRIKKTYKLIAKTDRDKAIAFGEAAHRFINDSRPKRRKAGSMIIIEKVRRMVIEGKVYELESFQQEIAPLLKPKKD